MLQTRDLTDIGVPRCYLARICEEGLLVKVGYGQYARPIVRRLEGRLTLTWVRGTKPPPCLRQAGILIHFGSN